MECRILGPLEVADNGRVLSLGHDPFGIAADDGAVWVANRADFTVSRIDPRTNRVVATIRIGNRPMGIAAGEGAVWVSVG